jgi:UDP-glucose 4-epimerase
MNAFFNQTIEDQNAQYDAAGPTPLRVLITGGAGFLGAHVARHCIDLGMEVTVIDNFSGGFEENIPEGCRWMKMDITDTSDIDGLFANYRFDYVYHLAADARENLSHFTARHTYMNNLIGSVNIINACVNHDVKCLVFTSSIAVHANGQPPYEEGDNFMALDPYGISKAAVEIHLHKVLQMFGLNHVIFRPFNIYGPLQNIGDKYRNVIGIFMNQIMQGQPMTIFGDGEQQRAFSYIDDVAPHIAGCVLRPELYNSTFFIGGAQKYSVNELAHVVAAEFGVLPDIKYLQERHEAKTAYANTDKAVSAFGPAKVMLEEGVKRRAEWARRVGARSSKEFKNIEIRKNLPEGW